MTVAGGTICKYMRRISSSTGAGVPGYTSANFSITAWGCPYGGSPSAYTPTPITVTDLGSGFYAIQYPVAAASGYDGVSVLPATGSGSTDIIMPVTFSGEVENYDLRAIAALVARPAASITSGSVIAAPVPLTVNPYRYRSITMSVTDQFGNPVNLSGYTNWKIAIRDITQAAYKWEGWTAAAINTQYTADQGNLSISGNSSGTLTLTLPESLVGPVYKTWSASAARTTGDFVAPLASPNGFVYCCSTSGTSSGSEPTWPTTPGTTVTDGTAVWTCLAQSIWKASTAYALGTFVTPKSSGTPATGGVYMVCTQAGTSGSSEPVWGSAPTTGVTDGTAKWTVFNDPYPVLAQGALTATAYYEITAYTSGLSSEVIAIIPSSLLTVSRIEVGT